MDVEWSGLQAKGKPKRVFITGSTAGIGLLAARRLLEQGHQVVAHARNESKAADLKTLLPQLDAVVVGDLASIDQTCHVAEQVNALGQFDAVIQNAGIYRSDAANPNNHDIPDLFMVNCLAPYMLAALLSRPQRMVFVSSSLHQGADADVNDPLRKRRGWSASAAYGESKLMVAAFANALGRLWPGIAVNTIDPGWVPTNMGGRSATDDIEAGAFTQCWLAVSDEPQARESGRFFYHMREQTSDPRVLDSTWQEVFIRQCAQLSGVKLDLK